VARSVDAGVDLGFELESARIDGHGFLLREMLANLLDNAINYAGHGARITVRTGTAPSAPVCAMLEVEDNGPGIPAAQRERAFERFQRGNSGGTGSGLGLSIVRDIAGHHGAHAELLDGPGGIGLKVRITFSPVDAPPRLTRSGRA
jgi:two-component system sensor histidine kinase TctE